PGNSIEPSARTFTRTFDEASATAADFAWLTSAAFVAAYDAGQPASSAAIDEMWMMEPPPWACIHGATFVDPRTADRSVTRHATCHASSSSANPTPAIVDEHVDLAERLSRAFEETVQSGRLTDVARSGMDQDAVPAQFDGGFAKRTPGAGADREIGALA